MRLPPQPLRAPHPAMPMSPRVLRDPGATGDAPSAAAKPCAAPASGGSPRATLVMPPAPSPTPQIPSRREEESPQRARLQARTEQLLTQMGCFVRDHLVVISNREAHALGRLQFAVMQTSLAGQSGRHDSDEASTMLDAHAAQFEVHLARTDAQQLPPLAPWPSLPMGPATMACLRHRARLLQTLQKMHIAETRVRQQSGHDAELKLCQKLLSPRLTMAFIYDATRLLFIAAATQRRDLTRADAELASLTEAMRCVDQDLRRIFVQHDLTALSTPTDAAAPYAPVAAMPLEAHLEAFADGLMVLTDCVRNDADPMGFWAMTCESFRRLLCTCRMAQTARTHVSTLPAIVTEATAQVRQLNAWLVTSPPYRPPHAAPAA